ncbi:MAG: hypothetical protein ACSLFO_07415 [Acidimicrobiales bacterium]
MIGPVLLAHGVGNRADLPLPVWLFAYAASFALLISFVALRILWPRPRLAAASKGSPAPSWFEAPVAVLRVVAQVLVLVLFVVTVAAAWFGVDSVAANLAPTAFYVVFWVGLQLLSAVAGDVWHRVNPLYTIAAGFDRLAGRDPETDRSTGIWASHWPAAAGLLVFLWLELAYFDPGSVTPVGLFLGIYTAAMLAGALRFGAGWIRTGDGFAVLFTLLASLAPAHRDESGRLRLRWPLAGLAQVEPRRGTLAVILVLLGGTAFDGFSRTQLWSDQVGSQRDWDLAVVNTAGLLLVIGTVAVLFLVASRLVDILAGDDEGNSEHAWRWVPSLVPIVLAYSIAHYFSLLVFEGQAFVALLSDPFGEGWDLFGTASNLIDFTVISPNQIAYVQVGAIVIGHVVGVIAAHDRAVELYPEKVAVRSQYPLLGVMIAYTVGALVLLLNA